MTINKHYYLKFFYKTENGIIFGLSKNDYLTLKKELENEYIFPYVENPNIYYELGDYSLIGMFDNIVVGVLWGQKMNSSFNPKQKWYIDEHEISYYEEK